MLTKRIKESFTDACAAVRESLPDGMRYGNDVATLAIVEAASRLVIADVVAGLDVDSNQLAEALKDASVKIYDGLIQSSAR